MQSKTSKKNPTINSLRYINDHKHFLVCTNQDFRVYDSSSGEQKFISAVPGGVSLCDVYKNSNIFFFVGTGTHTDYPTTKLCLWNIETHKLVGEVQFNMKLQIVDLYVKGSWILVVFKDRCKLFHFDLGFAAPVKEFLTQPNSSHKSGQVALHVTSDESEAIIAFADKEQKGRIQLYFFTGSDAQLRKEKAIFATDKQDVAGLSFSHDGQLLHVAVDNGKGLRVYTVQKRELIKELARGYNPSHVNCIASDSNYMACCSDRKTVHIFNISSSVAQSQVLTESQMGASEISEA